PRIHLSLVDAPSSARSGAASPVISSGSLPLAVPLAPRAHSGSKYRACGRPVAVDDLEWQADQLVGPRLDAGKIQPFDDPDAGREQRMVGLRAVGPVATDGKVVHAHRPHLQVREIARGRPRHVDEVFDEFVALPTARRVAGLEENALATLKVMATQFVNFDRLW